MTRLAVIMDPIQTIAYQKDSTFALLLEAQRRGIELYYLEMQHLFLQGPMPYGKCHSLKVIEDPNQWFQLANQYQSMSLAEFDIILMRKDPPINDVYLYVTHLLSLVEKEGVKVINRPQALRDFNEKISIAYFPECIAPTLVTASKETLKTFADDYAEIVIKPLNIMGGRSVFRLKKQDVNANVVFETLTHNDTEFCMAQPFLAAIKEGDKRILMIGGEPIPYALARIPGEGDWRGNLRVGAKGKVQDLTPRDRFICNQVGPHLRENGIYFAGIDVIGDYLTEINITSPTCIREIEASTGLNICAQFFDLLIKAYV